MFGCIIKQCKFYLQFLSLLNGTVVLNVARTLTLSAGRTGPGTCKPHFHHVPEVSRLLLLCHSHHLSPTRHFLPYLIVLFRCTRDFYIRGSNFAGCILYFVQPEVTCDKFYTFITNKTTLVLLLLHNIK